MRKITKDIVEAFINRKAKSISNTSTDGKTLYLHNNAIARHAIDGLAITNAGWKSNTTKERLNGLPGVNIYQKKGVWYLNGIAWDGSWIAVK